MPLFTRGLARVGARVIGVGDQHADAVPHRVREALTAYVQIDNWFDEGDRCDGAALVERPQR